MKDIRVFRIDDRLIHGQIVTAWRQSSNADTIVVADDDAAKDTLRLSLFKMATPKSVDLKVMTIDEAVEYVNEDGPGKILLVSGSLESTERLINGGLEISEINLGNLSQSPDKTRYSKSIWLDEGDIQIINNLKEQGLELYVQVVPSEKRYDISELLK